MDFEWDLFKELENIRKHRVTFAEAVESFRDPRGVQLIDARHSDKKQRFYMGLASRLGSGAHDLVHPSWQLDPYHRQRGVAEVQKVLL